MNINSEQRARALVGIDGRQYARKPASYIDVLGLSSVSEAVHEASRMLRIGIEHAMAQNVDGDPGNSENAERQRPQSDVAQQRSSQPAPKEPVSVYSALSKRPRRPLPTVSEPPQQQQSGKRPEDNSTSIQRPGFAPRSWSSTKKAGPSILSKRTRSSTLTGKPGDKGGSLPAFQPASKREKLADTSSKDSISRNVSKVTEKKPATGGGASLTAQSNQQIVSGSSAKTEITEAGTSPGKTETPVSTLRNPSSNTSKAPASSWMTLQPVASSSAARAGAKNEIAAVKSQPASLSPTTRKVGLPPSWCQVSAKSFKKDAGVKQPSALSLLRKSGTSKPRELPAAPRGSSILPSLSAVKQHSSSNFTQTKLGKSVFENGGLIPLPSSTGIKVKYVPGSEIIDGVRPNGYTVSIDGIVKPVVTFNPKPKLPHKLRQTSVEKLFEAWRDNAKAVEGDALARALRTEQEMYAKAKNRADYRAAVTMKLKDLRKADP